MNTPPVIQANDLTKRYEDLVAVDRISFDVSEGEIFGLLGPNGSGKSTTIRMLVGLSRPSGGRATILGRDILSGMIEAKKQIGVVPDISNLYDELSARENLLFMARLYGVPKALQEQRADDLLRAFGLYERKEGKFGSFSRGMKRALTIAAALIHEPRILFLDEPTVGLDVVAARSLRNLISNLRAQGLTIILTTHYLEEADHLCDRIAILVKGKIVSIDTPEGLKSLARGRLSIEFTFSSGISKLMDNLSERLSDSEVALLDESRVRIYGDDPQRIFREAFRFSEDHGLGLEAVNSVFPSLEDAFVRITGLSPVVMLKEKGGK